MGQKSTNRPKPVERVPIPRTESLGKITFNYLRHEVRDISFAIGRGMSDTFTILKHIFWLKTVDKGIREKAAWFELFPKKPNGRALLLCHGFANSPEMFKEVAPAFQKQGYYVRAVRLSGHGTTVGHLAQTNGSHWFSSVVWHYFETRKKYDQIDFLGHSVGGTLGLILATIYPIRKVAVIAAPIKLNIPPARLARHVSGFIKYWPRSRRKRKMIRESGLMIYTSSPLYATYGVFEVGKVLWKRAEKLTLPVLYIRAEHDARSFQDQDDVFKNHYIHTPIELKLAENSPHPVFLGPERDLIVDWIIEWLEV